MMDIREGVATQCRYQRQGSPQTLREGLAEYYATNPNLFSPEQLASDESLGQLGRFFAAHDACHVLFGLDTSLPDETLADTWTFFATDVQWKELWSYVRSDGQKQFFQTLMREVGYGRLLLGSLHALPRVAKVLWTSRWMPRKWPLHDWEAHLDAPLCELREQYRIRLV